MSMRWKFILIALLTLGIFFAAGSVVLGNRSIVDAKGSAEKRFTSIQVKKGDSLWSIAKEHMSEEYHSIGEYIEEVCKTNHIYDENIKEDMYLIIPYYTKK